MKIINYEEKEMIPLTDKENKSYVYVTVYATYAKMNLVLMKMIKCI